MRAVIVLLPDVHQLHIWFVEALMYLHNKWYFLKRLYVRSYIVSLY